VTATLDRHSPSVISILTAGDPLQRHYKGHAPDPGENRPPRPVVQSREIPAFRGVARIEGYPTMRSRLNLVVALSSVLVIAAACGGGQPTTAPTQAVTAVPATQPPASDAPASEAPMSEAPTDATVLAEEVGDAGTILVDGATGLTLYLFTEDEKDSGESACNEGCIAAWPALTVEAGETPTGGAGVDAAKLGTITRDDGDTQVTYDGLPLYFFAQDTQPGDLKGVYPMWETVAP
jgi:predicted lipoprotein with Yx(FWY)xxD motif